MEIRLRKTVSGDGYVGQFDTVSVMVKREQNLWVASVQEAERGKQILAGRTLRALRKHLWPLVESMLEPRLAQALQILAGAPVLRAVRVSRALAGGSAGRSSYWGAVRYEVRWSSRLQWPVSVALSSASRARRSKALAEADAAEMAAREGRFLLQSIGRLSRHEVMELAEAWRSGRVKESEDGIHG